MVGSEIASDSIPMMIRIHVTNNPKLSANTTPKLDVLWFHNSSEDTAAPIRPIAPSGPIGIRSPGARNASATMAASAAAVTQDIGTMALKPDNINVASAVWNLESGPNSNRETPGSGPARPDGPGQPHARPTARSIAGTGSGRPPSRLQ